MRLLLAALLAALAGAGAAWAAIPEGSGSQSATLPGAVLTVFTYRPACPARAILIVFHGVGRDADAYRDHAIPLADRTCAVVVAPLFDRTRFPRDLYQYGGVAEQPAPRRTVDLAAPLVEWARGQAGLRDGPAVLLGHSAGAQFLVRVAAFAPPPGVRFIVANPSTWVWPGDAAPPFGLGPANDPAVRAYLGQPVAVLLGGEDTGTRNLAMSPEAMAQGRNRLERGRDAFARAQEVARAHGWRLGWSMAVVPGVGHDATRMFGSAQALTAMEPGR